MSAGLLDELLADFTALAGIAHAAPTPAKAAKAANREHPCGLAPASVACEALRIAANGEQRTADAEPDSQIFAAVRRLPTEPQSEQTCGSSQESQVSQGWPPTYAARGAADLATECPAVAVLSGPKRAANDPTRRPYRLTPEQGDRCHAGGWDDAEMAAFTARHARLLRAGHGNVDAEDLAERLTLRDRDADERRLCIECKHYRPGRCGNHRRAGLQAPDVGRDLATLLQRCPGFQPSR